MALILVFVNTSNLAPISDYNVQVLVGDGTPARSHTINQGVVKGHCRADGWEKLVRTYMSQCTQKGELQEKQLSEQPC